MSGLIIKRLGSGGLKLGGGEIETDDGGSCCVVVTEGEEFSPDMALMEILVVGGLVLGNGRGLWSGNWERLRVPDAAMAMTLELGGEVKSVRILSVVLRYCLGKWKIVLCFGANLSGQ